MRIISPQTPYRGERRRIMLSFKMYRYAIRNGKREDDRPSEVEWKMRTTKDGIYIETENNVYFLDIRKGEHEEETQVFLKKVLEI